MTDQELIQTIKAIVAESEERMTGRIAESEERMTGRIAESEERMTGRMTAIVAESEERTAQTIQNSKSEVTTELMAYIDETVYKAIQTVADGHKMLAEKFARIDEMADDIDEIKGSIAAVEAIVNQNTKNIIRLDKAHG